MKKRFVVPHVPLFLSRRIFEDLVTAFPDEVRLTTSHRFRDKRDLQFGLTFASFVRDFREPYSPEALLRLVDRNKNQKIEEGEFDALTLHLRMLIGRATQPSIIEEALRDCMQDCRENDHYPLVRCISSLEKCQSRFWAYGTKPKWIPKYL